MIQRSHNPATKNQRSWRLPLATAVIFTAIGLVFAFQRYVAAGFAGDPLSWRTAWIGSAIVWWSWALVTPLIAWLAHKLPISVERPWAVAVHIPAGVAVAIVHAVAIAAITPQFFYRPAFAPIRDMFRGRISSALAFDVLVYFLILTVVYLIGYVRDSRRREIESSQLEAALARSQLVALQGQLQPHFLFNTLNSIVALISVDPDRATLMIRKLSDLLRYCLAVSERSEVPLSEEIEFARAYLEIQKIRFEDRLEYQFDIDRASSDGLVPSFVLQPLVENAVKFSLNDDAKVGHVRVSSSQNDGQLKVMVSDDGPGITQNNMPESTGIGIRTTRARLEQLYGSDLQFKFATRDGGGTVVSIGIPYHTDESALAG